MDNFSASIHTLFNHRPAEHQPNTQEWIEGYNVHQLHVPPAVAQIDEAMQQLRTLALRGELVEARLTVGTLSGRVTQTVITP